MKLNLTRPLIFFDLETTGTNVLRDRIVEISLIKVFPDGREEHKSRRLTPEMHIPAEATAVHHITDEDVANEPTFRQIANSLAEIFADSDVAGYNSNKFDVPLLIEEFARVGVKFDMEGRRFIDVQNIFHKMEQRTLIDAYRFYCGKELNDAHSAHADTKATYEVLCGQLERYPDLENDVQALADFSRMNRSVDLSARIVLNDDNVEVFNFGKHKGRSVKDVFTREPSFYFWMMQGEFGKDTKDVITRLYAETQKSKKCSKGNT